MYSQRRFDVMMTLLLRRASVGVSHTHTQQTMANLTTSWTHFEQTSLHTLTRLNTINTHRMCMCQEYAKIYFSVKRHWLKCVENVFIWRHFVSVQNYVSDMSTWIVFWWYQFFLPLISFVVLILCYHQKFFLHSIFLKGSLIFGAFYWYSSSEIKS